MLYKTKNKLIQSLSKNGIMGIIDDGREENDGIYNYLSYYILLY